MDIYIDNETGVEYLISKHGICPRYNSDGSLRICHTRNKHIYIAYGNNLNEDTMAERCPDAELIGASILKGWELVFTGNPYGAYLSIREKENSCVPVAVYELSQKDLERLDYWENAPDTYYKKTIPVAVPVSVHIDNTDLITHNTYDNAFTYVMKNKNLGIPTKDYFLKVLKGYQRFGFDSEDLLNSTLKKSGIDNIESLP